MRESIYIEQGGAFTYKPCDNCGGLPKDRILMNKPHQIIKKDLAFFSVWDNEAMGLYCLPCIGMFLSEL